MNFSYKTHNLASPAMQDKAFEVASKWIHGNFKVFNKTKNMYEKYNVIGDVPEPGGGGEYEVIDSVYLDRNIHITGPIGIWMVKRNYFRPSINILRSSDKPISRDVYNKR
jgi:hypothetical protein